MFFLASFFLLTRAGSPIWLRPFGRIMSDSEKTRGSWGSRAGFVIAAAGSAIGLGNIWKFPYIVGQNGGGAFVIVYLICIALIGLPIMLAEFTIGRKTHKNPVGAYKDICPQGLWFLVGGMGVLAGFLILSFYSVVAGWTIAYIVKSIFATVTHFESASDAGKYFGEFAANPLETLFYHTIFMVLCMSIVIKGVRSGIERWCTILMPTLLFILVLLVIRSLTLDGAWEGVVFYLKPDFSKLTAHGVLVALGHAFFSLSLGMGAMITYGSYLSEKENLASSALIVGVLDTVIALLAGLMIFPAVFAMGLEPSAGPGLVFHVLPAVFSKMPFGSIVSVAFFALLAIAALTSGISLLEVVVAYFIDEIRWSRKKAVLIVGGVVFVLGIPSALSFGAFGEYKLFGMNFFDIVDQIASNYLLHLGGLLICVFVGYVWGSKPALEEVHIGEHKFPFAGGWVFLIKYISPFAVGIILIAKLMGK